MTSLLEDVRVLDLTHGIAGPYCTKLLADYGAEVIKIERPGAGDLTRAMGPFPGDLPHSEQSGLFLHLNTNKQSLSLNLKTETGKRIVRDLVRQADIVVESFRPGAMDRLGLSYDQIREINPTVTMASVSNFGQTGPYRDYALTEIIAYAMGTNMHCTGVPDREPLKMGGTATLFQAGNTAAMAVIAAFYGARWWGLGQYVDCSIVEGQASSVDRSGASLMAIAFSGLPGFQRTFMRRGSITPYGAYPCADGYAHFTSPQQAWWRRFCEIIEQPELADDPRYHGENFNNLDLAPEIDEAFLPWILTQTKRQVMEKASEVAGTPINTMEDLFDDPLFRERGFFVPVKHPLAGTIEYPGAPFKPAATPCRAGRAPLLGEHNVDILQGRLGFNDGDLVTLARARVI